MSAVLNRKPNRKDSAMRIYRQGDVIIVAIDTIPTEAKPVARENGRIVLAHGEVTGHAHAIDAPDTEAMFLATDLTEMADRFLRVEQEVRVVHDEHDTITLPPGNYLVRRQREYQSADMPPLQAAD